MKLLDWIAAVVLCLQSPIPFFWLIVHPQIRFWRRHGRAAFVVAGVAAWGGVAVLVGILHARLFASRNAPRWAIAVGLALLVFDVYLLYRVERELGTRRLVGQAELEGTGELATGGLYGRIRHPRYTGMMLSVLGACLIAGTLVLWVAAGVWWLLAIVVVRLEERELRARFGAAYVAYAKRVPRFLPFRFWPREE